MPSMEYQRDGSCIVTNDAGEVIIVPPGKQSVMDAAVQAHIGDPEPAPPTLEEQVKAMAALLVQKGVATDVEMKESTKIDTVAVAADIKPA